MLTQICQYLRNWFARGIFTGDFIVSGGVLTYADGSALPLVRGQYFRVVGSLFNDGVHKLQFVSEESAEEMADNTEESTQENDDNDDLTPESEPEQEQQEKTDALIDEPVFSGAVWSMAVPAVVIELADEITEWCTANAAAISSPYQSESFGGYSYSLRGAANSNGEAAGASWQSQFAAQLNPWRKI